MATYHPVNENNQPRTYQDRYRRDAGSIMDKLYNVGPYIVAFVSFVLILLSVVALALFDLATGGFTASYMLNAQMGWFSSLATTGLVLALFGTVFYGWRERWAWYVIVPIALAALVPASIDVYFDALSVDIMRFGHIIQPSVQFVSSPADIMPHELYRIMVGAISAVSDPLMAGSVVIFPVFKEILRRIFSS